MLAHASSHSLKLHMQHDGIMEAYCALHHVRMRQQHACSHGGDQCVLCMLCLLQTASSTLEARIADLQRRLEAAEQGLAVARQERADAVASASALQASTASPCAYHLADRCWFLCIISCVTCRAALRPRPHHVMSSLRSCNSCSPHAGRTPVGAPGRSRAAPRAAGGSPAAG